MVWVLLGVVLIWLLMSLKTSRADGTLLEVHPYRRMMPYIMRGRNESVVYYDDYIDAEKLLEYVEAVRERMRRHGSSISLRQNLASSMRN